MWSDVSRGRIGRWLRVAWRSLASLPELAVDMLTRNPDVEVHTTVTFRAATEAVLPETPALGDELGHEHVHGGLAVNLDDFVVTYVDNGFQFGLPHVGPHGNLPLADPIAHALDAAALELLERGENVAEPRDDRPASLLEPGEASPSQIAEAAGPFSKLSRRDRLRAISILDEFELKISPADSELFEFDAGLVGQLVVGFTELIYYSEWQGYDEYFQPPSERTHSNAPASVQGWRQTGYPGVRNGFAAFRGYLGSDGGSLGAGETWATINPDSSVEITLESGSFRENEYDTSGYEEPYPE